MFAINLLPLLQYTNLLSSTILHFNTSVHNFFEEEDEMQNKKGTSNKK